MTPTAFELLCQEIDALPSHGLTREDFKRVIRSFAGERINVPRARLRRDQRIRHAARMLERGVPRALAVESLEEVFGISRRTAYRAVNAAMNQRRKPAHRS